MILEQERELRSQFFTLVFGEKKGYICIATDNAVKGAFSQKFFQWPSEEGQLLTHVARNSGPNKNVWFCVNILKNKVRTKESCIDSNLIWADLDTCNPNVIQPKPQIVIESSPDRFQGIWRLDRELDTKIAEDYSRKIAYSYKVNGADTGCWNLGRLLPCSLYVQREV